MKEKNIVIATIKSWNIANANLLKNMLKGKYRVFIIESRTGLNCKSIMKINPEYIFIPHWSWMVADSVYKNFECIIFHMTDLPYGRGGSPLQNLILRKIYNTKISAAKVDKNLDAGEIYIKKHLYIGQGSAEEIFKKASRKIFFEMIPFILKNRPVPHKQKGNALYFRRRKPEESDIAASSISTLGGFYDFIRMVDAEGYPRAFLKKSSLKITFAEVCKRQGKLSGRFEIENTRE